MVDECHLLWGYLCSYNWGIIDKINQVPMKKYFEKSTYYGAYIYQNK